MPKRILFVCSYNAARSPMAEALVNHYLGDRYEAMSAGSDPRPVRPEAVRVMAELGIDISAHRPTGLRDLGGRPFDLAVTVCPSTDEACPFYPQAKETMHHAIEPPPGLDGDEGQRLQAYRAMRDEIRRFIMDELG